MQLIEVDDLLETDHDRDERVARLSIRDSSDRRSGSTRDSC